MLIERLDAICPTPVSRDKLPLLIEEPAGGDPLLRTLPDLDATMGNQFTTRLIRGLCDSPLFQVDGPVNDLICMASQHLFGGGRLLEQVFCTERVNRISPAQKDKRGDQHQGHDHCDDARTQEHAQVPCPMSKVGPPTAYSGPQSIFGERTLDIGLWTLDFNAQALPNRRATAPIFDFGFRLQTPDPRLGCELRIVVDGIERRPGIFEVQRYIERTAIAKIHTFSLLNAVRIAGLVYVEEHQPDPLLAEDFNEADLLRQIDTQREFASL